MQSKRILITGVTGFAGGHLAELLSNEGSEVHGIARRTAWPANWSHLNKRVQLHTCDLLQSGELRKLLQQVQPEQVYHLAGYASVSQSFQEPTVAWAGNLTATLNLYDGLLAADLKPRVLYVGSGLVYGDPDTPDELFDEQRLLKPVSPYAASKSAADLASYQYCRSSGLPVIRVRPFNHIGPRQSPQFAVAYFAQQVAAVLQGIQPPQIQTGDLRSKRDLTDVRDMVRAYQLLMEHGQPGEAYNVGSGEAHSMDAVLTQLQLLAGIKLKVEQRTERLRATDTAVTRADASKLRRETGWSRQWTLEQTLRDTLDYWRLVISGHAATETVG